MNIYSWQSAAMDQYEEIKKLKAQIVELEKELSFAKEVSGQAIDLIQHMEAEIANLKGLK